MAWLPVEHITVEHIGKWVRRRGGDFPAEGILLFCSSVTGNNMLLDTTPKELWSGHNQFGEWEVSTELPSLRKFKRLEQVEKEVKNNT